MAIVQKLGVPEVKKLASAVAKLGTAAGRVMEDGTVGITDIPAVPAILSGLKDLSAVDFRQVLPELKDLDDAERADLAASFEASFDLKNDAVEKTVEQGLELCLLGVQAILTLVEIGQKVKAKAA